MRVTDTQKANDIYVHSGVIEQGNIKTGDKVEAVIDGSRRRAIMSNHTATHLLQAALRETLGTHIKQQGSLVEEDGDRRIFEPKKLEEVMDYFAIDTMERHPADRREHPFVGNLPADW